MPHAALWVVQRREFENHWTHKYMFQCRTRLCGWCSFVFVTDRLATHRFNAARGFVGGAALEKVEVDIDGAACQCRTRLCGWCSEEGFVYVYLFLEFQCRTRLCWWCSSKPKRGYLEYSLFQCRTRLCGWCSRQEIAKIFSCPAVSMPHAALWVVQPRAGSLLVYCHRVSMPHAALWVVQHHPRKSTCGVLDLFQCRTRLCGWCNGSALRRALLRRRVSMPHAALWVVQLGIGTKHFTKLIGFNAARGFVGGATIYDVNSCITGIRFQCRTRLCGWCNPLIARLDKQVSAVSMPHAALWVVQRSKKEKSLWRIISFNAARGFVGGATGIAYMLFALSNVSMPHAALWVVQLAWQDSVFLFQRSFNAARGFVGGATSEQVAEWRSSSMFQCRTRLCGWCNRRFANLWRHNSAVSMPHAALWVVQPHRSQPLSPYGEKALLESLRKFEMSDGKYVKYLFLFSFSLRRNPLRDQHLARP